MACKVHVERGVQYDAARLIIIQLTSILFSPVVTFPIDSKAPRSLH
jgi:hypothetical protein